MYTKLDNLPTDILLLVALELPPEDLMSLCNTNKKFNERICGNDDFWYNKIQKDFNVPQVRPAPNNWSLRQTYRELWNNLTNYGLLFNSARQNNIEGVQLALYKGDKVNNRDVFGYTILIRASEEGHSDMIKLLLDAGADPNMATYRGIPPLFYAANVDLASVKLLLEAGADPTHKDRDGNTVLMWATDEGGVNGDEDIYAWLIQNMYDYGK